MSKYHYLTLPNQEKIPLFKQQKNKKPQFCEQFIILWSLLYNIGKADINPFTGIVSVFPLPIRKTSKLIGKSIIQSSSRVKIYSFNNENLDGPIITSGYNLETYNDSLYYKISWKIGTESITQTKNNLKDFKIGFYRSDGYSNDNTNTFSLICGSRGASLFNKTSGSFISPGITNIFVAANKDIIIELEVEVIVPKQLFYPDLTRCYTKFIVVDYNNNKYKIPVYRIYPLNKAEVIKKPTKYFHKAAKVIQNYLIVTGLSVNLINYSKFQNSSIKAICSNCTNSPCDNTILGTREYYTNAFTVNIAMDSGNTCDPKYWIAGVYQGIELAPPDGKVSRITYEITSDTGSPKDQDFVVMATVKVQYLSGLILYTHNVINNDGSISDREAKLVVEIGRTQGAVSLKDSVRISETAKAFTISIYYYVYIINASAAATKLIPLKDNTKFRNVLITYEDKIVA